MDDFPSRRRLPHNQRVPSPGVASARRTSLELEFAGHQSDYGGKRPDFDLRESKRAHGISGGVGFAITVQNRLDAAADNLAAHECRLGRVLVVGRKGRQVAAIPGVSGIVHHFPDGVALSEQKRRAAEQHQAAKHGVEYSPDSGIIEPVIGETVAKYRLLEEIGRGAMGRVYKAQDLFLGRIVALKLIADKYLQNPEALMRFQREGQATAALAHPNICTVFEAGQWRGIPFLAMEYLEGITLTERMKKGTLDVCELLEIAIPVAGALAATHAIGVIHRDIKPANLFLTHKGQVKVLDFGLAKMLFRSQPGITEDMPTMATFATLPGTILGTLAYMAPEQVRGEYVDARADLYSFGIVLYEALTGALPVRGAAAAPLPEELAPVVRRLIEIDRAARFQSAAEVYEALLPLRNVNLARQAGRA